MAFPLVLLHSPAQVLNAIYFRVLGLGSGDVLGFPGFGSSVQFPGLGSREWCLWRSRLHSDRDDFIEIVTLKYGGANRSGMAVGGMAPDAGRPVEGPAVSSQQ